jgi:hypothetical protein
LRFRVVGLVTLSRAGELANPAKRTLDGFTKPPLGNLVAVWAAMISKA